MTTPAESGPRTAIWEPFTGTAAIATLQNRAANGWALAAEEPPSAADNPPASANEPTTAADEPPRRANDPVTAANGVRVAKNRPKGAAPGSRIAANKPRTAASRPTAAALNRRRPAEVNPAATLGPSNGAHQRNRVAKISPTLACKIFLDKHRPFSVNLGRTPTPQQTITSPTSHLPIRMRFVMPDRAFSSLYPAPVNPPKERTRHGS